MTEKQQMFVNEYLLDLNAKQAAIRAGYSERTAEVIGYQLLHKTSVSEAIEAAQGKRAESAGLNAQWVLDRLKLISDRCIQGEPVLNFNKITQEYEPTGEWKFDSMGANKATELIGKHLGMFTDKITMTVRTIDDFLSETDEADES